MPIPAIVLAPGIRLWKSYCDRKMQENIVRLLRNVLAEAPLFTPRMPKTLKPFSVRMTNCGALGWISDERGYRYQATHPATERAWPPIPEIILSVWKETSGYPADPEACLVNFYDDGARMGLHQDRDESDLEAPIVSISLGNSCKFRFGGTCRREPTRSMTLESGDVIAFGGPARLVFHGVDRILPNTSSLLPQGGRINLTLRRVTPGRASA